VTRKLLTTLGLFILIAGVILAAEAAAGVHLDPGSVVVPIIIIGTVIAIASAKRERNKRE
jgi:hypothetical protein